MRARGMLSFLVGALAFAAMGGSEALAVDHRAVVAPGSTKMLTYHFGHDKNCAVSDTPEIKVTLSPQHGELTTKDETHPIRAGLIGSVGHCLGVPIMTRAIYYHASPGYHGSDSLTYLEVRPSTTLEDHWTIDIR
jgi:hypothetical protein